MKVVDGRRTGLRTARTTARNAQAFLLCSIPSADSQASVHPLVAKSVYCGGIINVSYSILLVYILVSKKITHSLGSGEHADISPCVPAWLWYLETAMAKFHVCPYFLNLDCNLLRLFVLLVRSRLGAKDSEKRCFLEQKNYYGTIQPMDCSVMLCMHFPVDMVRPNHRYLTLVP